MKARYQIDDRDTDPAPSTLPEGCEEVWIKESDDDDPPEGFEGRVISADEVDDDDETESEEERNFNLDEWWG